MTGIDERKDSPESFGGTRKLIRPHLPAADRRRDVSHTEDPLSHALTPEGPSPSASSHAEAFYFQKQIQQQTELTIVLEDGEAVHGVLEWYDQSAIKLRSGRRRILIYKAAIKYLYKAAETHPPGTVMK